MPAWKSEHVLTDNPRTEVSLIYYGNRAGLEDRVLRVRSGRSVASTPLPRTQHGLTNIVVQPGDEDTSCTVLSNWTVHQFRPKQQEVEVLFGRYRHELAVSDGALRIRRKKIVLLNDSMHTMIDFYSL
jgi:3-phenylpropionate/cinnamic acid dioxygenase small subunit